MYIMASPSPTLYVGLTNNVARRVLEHKSKPAGAFDTRSNVSKLFCHPDRSGIFLPRSAAISAKGFVTAPQIQTNRSALIPPLRASRCSALRSG